MLYEIDKSFQNRSRNEIKEIMPQMDVVIEVIDARIPYSSENPMVAALRGEKPVIKILNKAKFFLDIFPASKQIVMILCTTIILITPGP